MSGLRPLASRPLAFPCAMASAIARQGSTAAKRPCFWVHMRRTAPEALHAAVMLVAQTSTSAFWAYRLGFQSGHTGNDKCRAFWGRAPRRLAHRHEGVSWTRRMEYNATSAPTANKLSNIGASHQRQKTPKHKQPSRCLTVSTRESTVLPSAHYNRRPVNGRVVRLRSADATTPPHLSSTRIDMQHLYKPQTLNARCRHIVILRDSE